MDERPCVVLVFRCLTLHVPTASGASNRSASGNGGLTFNETTAITARLSRGMMLDVVVFVANITLMNLLADRFLELVRLANEGGDPVARFALFLFALGMLALPAAGAVLKRRHFHRRGGKGGDAAHFSGCLPIFHLVLSLISHARGAVPRGLIFGGGAQDRRAGELLFFLAALVLGVVRQGSSTATSRRRRKRLPWLS